MAGLGPICRYVNANLQGMSPLKIGVKGDIPPCAFKSLCLAFESYVRIMQINSKDGEITYKKLLERINALLRHDYCQNMLQRVLRLRQGTWMRLLCKSPKIVEFAGRHTQTFPVGLITGNLTWWISALR